MSARVRRPVPTFAWDTSGRPAGLRLLYRGGLYGVRAHGLQPAVGAEFQYVGFFNPPDSGVLAAIQIFSTSVAGGTALRILRVDALPAAAVRIPSAMQWQQNDGTGIQVRRGSCILFRGSIAALATLGGEQISDDMPTQVNVVSGAGFQTPLFDPGTGWIVVNTTVNNDFRVNCMWQEQAGYDPAAGDSMFERAVMELCGARPGDSVYTDNDLVDVAPAPRSPQT